MAANVCILCQQNTVSLECLPLHRPSVLLRADPGTALSPSALHLVNLSKCEPIKYSLKATPYRNLFTAWLCRPAYLDKSDNANSADIKNTLVYCEKIFTTLHKRGNNVKIIFKKKNESFYCLD